MDEKKTKALELILKGHSIVSIAEEISVHRNTIYHWLNTDEGFKKAKAKSEEMILDNLYTVALTEMEELLYNGTNYEKIQCATQILKVKKGTALNVTLDKPKTLDELLLTI